MRSRRCSATTRHIEADELPGYGVVLVGSSRHALYAFVPEAGEPPARAGACAAVWPPLRITIEGTLDSSPVLEESLARTEPDDLWSGSNPVPDIGTG